MLTISIYCLYTNLFTILSITFVVIFFTRSIIVYLIDIVSYYLQYKLSKPDVEAKLDPKVSFSGRINQPGPLNLASFKGSSSLC